MVLILDQRSVARLDASRCHRNFIVIGNSGLGCGVIHRVIVELRHSRRNPTLNAKMVRAPQYLEGPSISPVVVPAQQSESVALNLFNSNVLINASLVVKEVPNHFEGGLHWAIVHQLHFNFLQIFRNSLLNLAVCFVLTEGYLYCKSHIDNKENFTSS